MASAAQKTEIGQIQTTTYQTKRATVPALEELLYEPLQILDHGFIRLIDYMGNDDAIVQAARISYGAGTKKVSLDRALINYLMRHRHTSPFEMCEIKLHIKMPIFVARQWIRHRTANVNEYSARYSILSNEFYIPAEQYLASQSNTNNQGREGNLSKQEAARVLELLKQDAEQTYNHYREMLNEDEHGNKLDPERDGLTRELARMNLPTNFYTEMYWKIDLHNLLHFLALRTEQHAQWEIRAYADEMLNIVKQWVPLTYDAFIQYKLHGAPLSKKGMDVVRKLISGEPIDQKTSGMGTREWQELMASLELDESQ